MCLMTVPQGHELFIFHYSFYFFEVAFFVFSFFWFYLNFWAILFCLFLLFLILLLKFHFILVNCIYFKLIKKNLNKFQKLLHFLFSL